MQTLDTLHLENKANETWILHYDAGGLHLQLSDGSGVEVYLDWDALAEVRVNRIIESDWQDEHYTLEVSDGTETWRWWQMAEDKEACGRLRLFLAGFAQAHVAARPDAVWHSGSRSKTGAILISILFALMFAGLAFGAIFGSMRKGTPVLGGIATVAIGFIGYLLIGFFWKMAGPTTFKPTEPSRLVVPDFPEIKS